MALNVLTVANAHRNVRGGSALAQALLGHEVLEAPASRSRQAELARRVSQTEFGKQRKMCITMSAEHARLGLSLEINHL